METVPPHLVFVGAFDGRDSAEDASRELRRRGIGAAAQPAEAPPDDPGGPDHHPDNPTILRSGGFRDLVENMLRGFLVDTHAGSERERDARDDRWFVIASGVPADRHDEVRDVLGRRGRVRVIDAPAHGTTTPVDAEVAVFGPDVASLPGSPARWNEPREGVSPTYPRDRDPDRPASVVDDATAHDPSPDPRDDRAARSRRR